MSNKKHPSRARKDYYNNEITSTITMNIKNGDLIGALNLAEDYVSKYPDDELGVFYLARVYTALNRNDEAYELAKNAFESSSFHNHQAKMTAFNYYSHILFNVGRIDECFDLLKRAIDMDFVRNDDLNCIHIYTTMIDLLIDIKDYQKSLLYSSYFYERFNLNIFLLKKAESLKFLNRREEALEILENIEFEESDLEQERFINIGSIYSFKFLDSKKFEYLIKSDEYYHKSLTKKNDSYYMSCVRIAYNAIHKDNYPSAIKYANIVLDKYKDGEVNEKTQKIIYDAYRIMAHAYFGLGNLDKAKEYIDLVPEELNTILIYKYLYSTKQYKELVDYCLKKIPEADDEQLNIICNYYVNSLIRLEEYDKALEVLESKNNYLTKGDYEKASAYIRSKKGIEHTPYSCYSSKQIVNYNEEATINHICDRHLNMVGTLNFADREEIIKLLKEAKEKIIVGEGIPTGILDLYVLQFDEVRIKEDERCYAVSAITIPGTNNITTLFPIVSSRSTYKDEGRKKEVKRLSQIEKFNKRYGNN